MQVSPFLVIDKLYFIHKALTFQYIKEKIFFIR